GRETPSAATGARALAPGEEGATRSTPTPGDPRRGAQKRYSGFCGAIRGRVRRVIWGATCASAPRTPTGNGEGEPLVFGGWWAKFDSSPPPPITSRTSGSRRTPAG